MLRYIHVIVRYIKHSDSLTIITYSGFQIILTEQGVLQYDGGQTSTHAD